MVETIKISEMTSAGDFTLDQIAPVLSSGANRQALVQLQFSATGNTAQRPVSPATPTIRYNTDFEEFEFWDGMLWEQIAGSSDVAVLIARLAAHTVGDGASMIGLQNQGAVSGKTVQDFANASLLVKVGTSALVNGFALASLNSGFMVVTTATGDLVARTITGGPNQITVTDGTGIAANPEISIAANPVLSGTASLTIPTGSTAQRPPIPTDGMIRYNTSLNSFEYYDLNALAWVQPLSVGTGVTSVSGTTNRITSTGGTTPVIDISASYVGQNSITTLGTIGTGTWQGTVLSPTYGGTGVNNGASTFTTDGTVRFSGAFTFTGNLTGNTSVTFPTSGTLLTSAGAATSITGTSNQITASSPTGAVTIAIASNPIFPGSAGFTLPTGNTAARAGAAGTMRFNSQTSVFEATVDGATWATIETSLTGVLSVTGTANRITSTGGTTPVIDISASYVGQSSITTLGTIGTGVWQGTVVGATYGGTGVNNGASTITLGGSLTTSGSFASTFTMTGITGVTFPTSGTLATTSQIPTGAALTKGDDTNVTLTLAGSPTTALVNAASITAGWTGQLGLTRGGTAASLTANNGGIVYSTASALAILSGTATAGQMLQSGATAAPTWSTSTYPATNAVNTLLYASSANVMGALATANSSVLVTSGGGVPSLSTTLPSGLAATNLTLTTPALGTPSAGVLTNTTGGGGLRSFQIFKTGTGATYTKPANVTSILVQMVAGGGAGGGAASGVSGAAAGGGGGGGGFVQKFIASAASTYTYTVGAGGTAGTAGNNPGNAGGNTTFSGLTDAAVGGSGGNGMASTSTAIANVALGGLGGDVNPTDTLAISGGAGQTGIVTLGVGASGSGGYSQFGSASLPRAVSAAGVIGVGFGSGGSGGFTLTATDRAGGVGAGGLIVIWEFS
jgi:hypothetical protein